MAFAEREGTSTTATARAHRVDRRRGTTSRSATAPCSIAASSPTACASRRERRGRGQILRRLDGELAPGEQAIGGLADLAVRLSVVTDHRPTTDVRARIDQFLSHCGLAQRGASVVPLTGDASDRRYFRVLVPQDAVAGARRASRGRSTSSSCPFVNVAGLLAAMPVPVPRILGALERARHHRAARISAT